MALTKVQTNAIADDAVTTDKLANAINTERTANTAKVSLEDNAVTLAKMAGGTDGQIITYDASGDPVAVGPGTDGQVLTSTGAGSPPAFEDAAASVGGATGVDFNDDVKARFGTGNDLELYHVGSGPYSVIRQNDGPLYIQTDDTTNGISLSTYTDGETLAKFIKNGAVELYHDNAKKFNTASDGATVTGSLFCSEALQLNDSKKIELGTGQDLQIYYSGSDGFIKQPVGAMWTESSSWIITSANGGETMARFTENDAVKLYYDNSLKLETTSTGVEISSGNLHVGTNGNGITFESSANNGIGGSNTTLDDYEEGVFEVALNCHGAGSSGSITLSSSYQDLSYVKIGNLVHIQGRVYVDSVSSPSGTNVSIGNLPFQNRSAETDSSEKGFIDMQYHGMNTGSSGHGPAWIELTAGSNTGTFHITRNDDSWAYISPGAFVGNSYLMFSGTYRCN